MFVVERFKLAARTEAMLRNMEPCFGYDGFGELTFYRTYSREKKDGNQENWADVVIRATEGTFSIRKDWYKKNHITWSESYWQEYARKFALAMFKMRWMPPGRGLWAMGTDFVYERGAMALYNCSATFITLKNMSDDIAWLMDCLMHGVGVGFGVVNEGKLKLYKPVGTYDYVIPDSREGWTQSTSALIDAFRLPNQKLPIFVYDKLRKKGEKIKGFGGVASGPDPLKIFHENIIQYCHYFMGDMKGYTDTHLRVDFANGAGCCVVAGNVRRSAELCAGDIDDEAFLDLKDYNINPYREGIGWLSNNSVLLKKDSDFELLGEIARRVIRNGEPGYINVQNLRYGRIGAKMKGLRWDKAKLFNPCGEIGLEHREVKCMPPRLVTAA